jgi:hypothetical protein
MLLILWLLWWLYAQEIWSNMSHILIVLIHWIMNPVIDMTKFRIDAYQHLVGYMWIYTPHYYSNLFNCSIWLPVVVNILIFDLSQECFSLLQSWRVLHRPTHHITAYILSIGSLEVSSSVYLKFLMGTYCSYVRTLWEPF